MNFILRNIHIKIAVACLCISSMSSAATLKVGVGETYTTIQEAINAAGSGDTVFVESGTYALNDNQIAINKGISLIGEDEPTTIIDASSNTVNADYGIVTSASNITISNISIIPPVVPEALGTSSGGGYAIHVLSIPSSNLKFSNITITNGNRTGLDIQGADNVIIDHVTSRNAAYGNGITLTGVVNATLSNIVTSGNAWGGIALYVSSSRNRGCDSITIITANSSISEQNKIYSQDTESLVNTNISVGYDYTIKNNNNSSSSLYTWYQDNLVNAVAFSIVINQTWKGSFIEQISTGEFFVGSNMEIQTAINAADTGDVINISVGTFDDTLLVNKRIILTGAGSGSNGTILQSSSPPVIKGGATYPSGYRPVVRLTGSGILGDSLEIKNLRIRPRQDLVGAAYPHPGILFGLSSDIAFIKLDNVSIVGTVADGTPEMGIAADGSTSINHFSIINCEFKDMAYGLIFFNRPSIATNLMNFKFSNSILQNNSIKGLYTEKLSDAELKNLQVIDNGDPDRSPSWADANNAGLDINLKYGTYQNLLFMNIDFKRNGLGSSNGAGLTIKARDDAPSYNSNAGSAENVSIRKCVFNGNTNGILIGETGKSNLTPSGILINNNSMEGSASLGIIDNRGETADTIDAAGNWWGDADGPDDNASDGTLSHNNSAGEKIFEPYDKKIVYAPWYSADPDDNNSLPGIIQESPKLFLVKESVPLKSIGYINKGIKLASFDYVDTIDVQIENLSEIPMIDRKIVIKFNTPPILDSLDVTDDLELSSDITISGGLNLNNGNIMTGSGNKVVLDSTVSGVIENPNARIIGTIEVMPRNIGKGSIEILGLEIQSGSDDLGKISFTRKSGNAGIVNVGNNSGVGMTWEIDVDNQPSSGRDVSFSWLSEYDNGIDPTSVIVYRNTGTGWQYYAGPLDASGNPRKVTINVSGFSDWTIGGASNPLPVELIYFTATLNNKDIKLNWATANEVNNYGFEVERTCINRKAGSLSTEDEQWEILGFVEGHGNSSSQKFYSFIDDEFPVGELEYRLKQIDTDGNYEYSEIIELSTQNKINKIELLQNYPNPFNPLTNFEFVLPEKINVALKIYNTAGQEIKTIYNGILSAGIHHFNWDSTNNLGSEVASGIYIYRIIAGNYIKTMKMILLR